MTCEPTKYSRCVLGSSSVWWPIWECWRITFPPDNIKGFCQFVSIDDELILAPLFAGVPQNADEILLRKR